MVYYALKEARAKSLIWLLYDGTLQSLLVHPPQIVFALHKHGVLLKDTAMGFSVNHFLNQQLELGIDINGEILLTTFFL